MPEDPEEPEDDASVLTPEELELDDEREDAVKKIGENRYVIRPNEDAPDDGTDSKASSPGPLADPGEQHSPSPASQAQQDAAERGSASPGSGSPHEDADAREDAEARGASSPRSASPREDAGSRDAASEPSLADELRSSSLGSASPRQYADAREDADEQSSSSPRSALPREDAPDRSAPDVGVEARALALERAAGEYAIDAVVDTGDGVVERRLVADDQIAVFEQFLRWYARQVDPDAPPAATISALLAEADLSE